MREDHKSTTSKASRGVKTKKTQGLRKDKLTTSKASRGVETNEAQGLRGDKSTTSKASRGVETKKNTRIERRSKGNNE